MPPDLASLTVARSQATVLDRAARVAGLDDALVGGDRHPGAAPHLGQVGEGWRGLLDDLEPVLGHRPQPLDRGARAPGRVGVDPQQRIGAHRLPHAVDLGHVAGDAHLELEGREASLGPALRQPLELARVGGGEGCVAAQGVSLRRAEQLPDRFAGELAGEVVEGQVESRRAPAARRREPRQAASARAGGRSRAIRAPQQRPAVLGARARSGRFPARRAAPAAPPRRRPRRRSRRGSGRAAGGGRAAPARGHVGLAEAQRIRDQIEPLGAHQDLSGDQEPG